jgi:DNA-directed RNA polymerase subunit F
MILDRQPLNLLEVKEILDDIEDSDKKEQMELYLKKFLKIKPEKAKKLKGDLEGLDLLKMKNEHLAKIVDLIPESASDLNKIFSDVSLTEDETNKILEVVKSNK